MNKLFDDSKSVAAIPDAADIQIIWHDAEFIQYEQKGLDDKVREYYEIALISKKIFRIGIQKTLYQKLFELRVGIQKYNVELTTANRQFDLLEILIIPDKSDKHNMIYNTYDLELASTTIRSLDIRNITNTYSIANELKFEQQ